MSAFHDYVRGRSDVLPDGYEEAGMRLYRHLVYLGAHQLLEAHFGEVRDALGEEAWQDLLRAFIRDSRWDSHFYGDLTDDFITFLERHAA